MESYFIFDYRQNKPPRPFQVVGMVKNTHSGAPSEQGGGMDFFVWAANPVISRFTLFQVVDMLKYTHIKGPSEQGEQIDLFGLSAEPVIFRFKAPTMAS